MPRYFFHRADGIRDPDLEGLELSDVEAARHEAVVFAADTLKDDTYALWDAGEMRIEVTDSAQTLIFTIIISTVDGSRTLIAER